MKMCHATFNLRLVFGNGLMMAKLGFFSDALHAAMELDVVDIKKLVLDDVHLVRSAPN